MSIPLVSVYSTLTQTLLSRSFTASISHARNVSQWLIEKVTGKKYSFFTTQTNITLSQEQYEYLMLLVQKLTIEKYPLQYILETVPFGSLTLSTKPPTLIPRPETEEWCLNLIAEIQNKSSACHETNFHILDLCTGSGCIALLFAQAFPKAHLYALDNAAEALELAQHNAQKNGLSNITFIHSDLFSQVDPSLRFDLIVTNPPYIADEECYTLDPVVRQWEDKNALVATDNGLALIRTIIQQTPQWLNSHSFLKATTIPRLCVEIGHEQGLIVQQLFQQYGFFEIKIAKDYANKDRMVSGSFKK